MPVPDEGPQSLAGSGAGAHLPAEVPPEFADAYRAAYVEELARSSRVGEPGSGARTARRRASVSPSPALGRDGSWVRTVIAGLVAAALVLAAYGMGKAVSPNHARGTTSGGAGSGGDRTGTAKRPFRGKVTRLRVLRATASCVAPPGIDAAGHRVSYAAANMIDGDPKTAWRCDGRGVGTTMRFSFPEYVRVAEVGVIPGYAKTDPANGADRYAQNNRITEVSWTIGARHVVQRFSADPHDRSLRTIRVPSTTVDGVRLQVRETARGPRDTTAISEILIATAVD